MGIIYDEDKQKETFRFIDYFFICGLAEDKPIEVYKQLEENEFSSKFVYFIDKYYDW